MRFFLLCICIITSRLVAQTPNLDSLLQIISSSKKTDTAFINTLNEAGTVYWKQGDDSIAVVFHERAIREAKKIDFYLGEAKARLQLVRMEFEHMEDVDGMHKQLDTVMAIAKKEDDDWVKGMALFRKAQIYSLGFYEYSDTMPKLFEEARKLFIKVNDKVMEGSVYSELATIEGQEGRYAAAVDYLQKARKLQESTGNKIALRATLPNLGTMYLNMGLFDRAKEIFDIASANARELNDERVLAYVAYQKGDIYRKQEKYDSSLASYHEASELFVKSGAIQISTNIFARIAELYLLKNMPDSAMVMNEYADSLYFANVGIEETFFHYTMMNRARIYLYNKDFDKAIYYAQMGVDTLKKADVVLAEELKTYYKVLADAWEGKGDFKRSLSNFKLFKAWSDTLQNDETNQKVLTANLTYEFEKKQQKTELELEQAKQDQLIQSRNFLIALSALILLLAVVVLINNRKLRTKNKQLAAKNAEIERSLFRGQRIERKRIAAELHDNLNTQVAAIRWYLEAMDEKLLTETNQTLHARLINMVKDLYQDLRLIAHLLLPVALEKEGLRGALKTMVAKVNESQQTRFLLFYEGIDQLPDELSHQLYNICLELINNVQKHAGATEATLRLWYNEDDHLIVQMEDNGRGMNEAAISDGAGMKNISSRAASFKGTVEWKNNMEGGLTVTVDLPLDQAIVYGKLDDAY